MSKVGRMRDGEKRFEIVPEQTNGFRAQHPLDGSDREPTERQRRESSLHDTIIILLLCPHQTGFGEQTIFLSRTSSSCSEGTLKWVGTHNTKRVVTPSPLHHKNTGEFRDSSSRYLGRKCRSRSLLELDVGARTSYFGASRMRRPTSPKKCSDRVFIEGRRGKGGGGNGR